MEVRSETEQPTLAIRVVTGVEKLPEVMGTSFGEIFHFLLQHGQEPAGPPYALYHNMDMENLDLEIGVPFAGTLKGEGHIVNSTIPGGRSAVVEHLGPYETIEATYNKLMAFVAEQNLEPASYMYEFYLNDPDEVAPEEIRTEVHIPLKP